MKSLDAATLAQDAAFAQRMAEYLVREAGEAEDLVQEAWRSWLERPPRHGGNPRGYLRVVLRRLASRRRIARARRERRELEVARPEAAPSTEALVERMEIHKLTVAAVLQLAEPYRSTILLRFFENHSINEVALRQGVPVETVRTRQKRALKRLRESLDETAPGGREQWLGALAGLAFERAPLPDTPARLLPTLRSIPPATWVPATLVLGVTLALVVLQRSDEVPSALGDELVIHHVDSAARAEEPDATLEVARRSIPASAREDESLADADVTLEGAAPPDAKEAFLATGRVVDLDGAGIADALVIAYVARFFDGEEIARTRCDDEGRFHLPLVELARQNGTLRSLNQLRVTASADGFHPGEHALELTSAPSLELAAEIALAPGRTLVGRLLDMQGEGLSGAMVLVTLEERVTGERLGARTAYTDRHGTYRVPLKSNERPLHLESVEEGIGHVFFVFDPLLAAGTALGEIQAPDAALTRGATLAGRVVYPDDSPVRHATLKARLVRESQVGEITRLELVHFAKESGSGLVRARAFTDGEGRFTLTGLAPGRYLVGFWRYEPEVDAELGIAPEQVFETGRDDIELVLDRRRFIVGLDDVDGRPLSGAPVRLVRLSKSSAPGKTWIPGSGLRTVTQGTGAWAELTPPLPQAVAVYAPIEGCNPAERRIDVPDGVWETLVRVRLGSPGESASVGIELLGDGGTKPSDYLLELLTPLTSVSIEPFVGLSIDEAGQVHGLPTGSFRFALRPRPDSQAAQWMTPVRNQATVELDAGDVATARFDNVRGGKLRVRFVSPLEGEPTPVDELHSNFDHDANAQTAWIGMGKRTPSAGLHPWSAAKGAYHQRAVYRFTDISAGRTFEQTEAVEAGRYLLRAKLPECRSIEEEVLIEAGRVCDFDVLLALERSP